MLLYCIVIYVETPLPPFTRNLPKIYPTHLPKIYPTLSDQGHQYLGNRFPELLEIWCANSPISDLFADQIWSYLDKQFPRYQRRKLDGKNDQKKLLANHHLNEF